MLEKKYVSFCFFRDILLSMTWDTRLKMFGSKFFLGAILLLSLATSSTGATPTCSGTGCAVNQDGPSSWAGIMLNDGVTYVDYFKHQNPGTVTELAPPGAPIGGTASASTLEHTLRPAYTYLFSHVATSSNSNGTYEYGSGATLRTTCNLADQATTFADYSVHSTVPRSQGYPAETPAEYNSSRLETGLRGMNVLAAFQGNVVSGLTPTGMASEVFYYEDQPCTFGGHEYGFARDAASVTVSNYPGTVNFYVSDHTNCSGGGCNASDGVTAERVANYAITKLSNNTHGWIEYIYQAYFVADSVAPHGYIIRVQIVDPYTYGLETCANVTTTSSPAGAANPTPVATYPNTTGPCTFDVTPPSWYRADIVNGSSGYMFAGFILSGNPDTVGNTPGLYIGAFDVGK